jgi:hypothetical protein
LAVAYGPLPPGLNRFFRFSDAGDEIEGGLALDLRKLSTIGHRFERSLFGEAVISGMVVVVLITGVVWSLPDAEFKRRLTPVLQPIASAAGLEQSWYLAFIPPETVQRLPHSAKHMATKLVLELHRRPGIRNRSGNTETTERGGVVAKGSAVR